MEPAYNQQSPIKNQNSEIHWPSVIQFSLSLLGILILWGLAAGAAFGGLVQNFNPSAPGAPGLSLLLLNGDPWPQGLPPTKGNIEAIIRLYMLEKQQYSACPEMKIDSARQYIATLHTDKGDIVIELFPDKAPIAVNNFIFLARNGWFNNVTFHRVLPGFVAQTGDPSSTGLGGPGYAFVNETSPDLKFDKAGMVGMANSGPDTNGSQFFITYAATPQLDGSYTIFGQVIKGMDVAEKLTSRDPSQGFDLPPGDKILSVDIQEK